jgi:hypothetical protein
LNPADLRRIGFPFILGMFTAHTYSYANWPQNISHKI